MPIVCQTRDPVAEYVHALPRGSSPPAASAPALDYAAAAMHAKRSCYACERTFTADQVQRDPGWTPTRNGWRCGDCSRAWARTSEHVRSS